MIAHFARSTAPTGWLKANGAAISRATYADLFSSIGTTFGSGDGSTTFNLPDLRGEFIRGWDDGRGADSGRLFGTNQGDEIKQHKHSMTFLAASEGSGSITDMNGFVVPASDSDLGSQTNTVAIQNTGSTETRPRNIALLACIKF